MTGHKKYLPPPSVDECVGLRKLLNDANGGAVNIVCIIDVNEAMHHAVTRFHLASKTKKNVVRAYLTTEKELRVAVDVCGLAMLAAESIVVQTTAKLKSWVDAEKLTADELSRLKFEIPLFADEFSVQVKGSANKDRNKTYEKTVEAFAELLCGDGDGFVDLREVQSKVKSLLLSGIELGPMVANKIVDFATSMNLQFNCAFTRGPEKSYFVCGEADDSALMWFHYLNHCRKNNNNTVYVFRLGKRIDTDYLLGGARVLSIEKGVANVVQYELSLMSLLQRFIGKNDFLSFINLGPSHVKTLQKYNRLLKLDLDFQSQQDLTEKVNIVHDFARDAWTHLASHLGNTRVKLHGEDSIVKWIRRPGAKALSTLLFRDIFPSLVAEYWVSGSAAPALKDIMCKPVFVKLFDAITTRDSTRLRFLKTSDTALMQSCEESPFELSVTTINEKNAAKLSLLEKVKRQHFETMKLEGCKAITAFGFSMSTLYCCKEARLLDCAAVKVKVTKREVPDDEIATGTKRPQADSSDSLHSSDSSNKSKRRRRKRTSSPSRRSPAKVQKPSPKQKPSSQKSQRDLKKLRLKQVNGTGRSSSVRKKRAPQNKPEPQAKVASALTDEEIRILDDKRLSISTFGRERKVTLYTNSMFGNNLGKSLQRRNAEGKLLPFEDGQVYMPESFRHGIPLVEEIWVGLPSVLSMTLFALLVSSQTKLDVKQILFWLKDLMRDEIFMGLHAREQDIDKFKAAASLPCCDMYIQQLDQIWNEFASHEDTERTKKGKPKIRMYFGKESEERLLSRASVAFNRFASSELLCGSAHMIPTVFVNRVDMLLKLVAGFQSQPFSNGDGGRALPTVLFPRRWWHFAKLNFLVVDDKGVVDSSKANDLDPENTPDSSDAIDEADVDDGDVDQPGSTKDYYHPNVTHSIKAVLPKQRDWKKARGSFADIVQAEDTIARRARKALLDTIVYKPLLDEDGKATDVFLQDFETVMASAGGLTSLGAVFQLLNQQVHFCDETVPTGSGQLRSDGMFQYKLSGHSPDNIGYAEHILVYIDNKWKAGIATSVVKDTKRGYRQVKMYPTTKEEFFSGRFGFPSEFDKEGRNLITASVKATDIRVVSISVADWSGGRTYCEDLVLEKLLPGSKGKTRVKVKVDGRDISLGIRSVRIVVRKAMIPFFVHESMIMEGTKNRNSIDLGRVRHTLDTHLSKHCIFFLPRTEEHNNLKPEERCRRAVEHSKDAKLEEVQFAIRNGAWVFLSLEDVSLQHSPKSLFELKFSGPLHRETFAQHAVRNFDSNDVNLAPDSTRRHRSLSRVRSSLVVRHLHGNQFQINYLVKDTWKKVPKNEDVWKESDEHSGMKVRDLGPDVMFSDPNGRFDAHFLPKANALVFLEDVDFSRLWARHRNDLSRAAAARKAGDTKREEKFRAAAASKDSRRKRMMQNDSKCYAKVIASFGLQLAFTPRPPRPKGKGREKQIRRLYNPSYRHEALTRALHKQGIPRWHTGEYGTSKTSCSASIRIDDHEDTRFFIVVDKGASKVCEDPFNKLKLCRDGATVYVAILNLYATPITKMQEYTYLKDYTFTTATG